MAALRMLLIFAVPAPPATGHGAPLRDGVRDYRLEREVERLQGPPHRRREHALEQALLRQEGRRPGLRIKEGGGWLQSHCQVGLSDCFLSPLQQPLIF